MSIRHLETFYNVVRSGGISRSVGVLRIQQPAISEQMQLLEDAITCRLFERQPFRINAAGYELYTAIRPFFDSVHGLLARIRTSHHQHMRIAAGDMFVENYLTAIVQAMVTLNPALRFQIQSGSDPQMRHWLEEGAVDVLITASCTPPTRGLVTRSIGTLPLALIVRSDSRILSADELWSNRPIHHPLVCQSEDNPIVQLFQRGLKQGGFEWHPKITVSSLEAVASFVRSGAGIGLTLATPGPLEQSNLRLLPLKGFQSVEMTALWHPGDRRRLKTFISFIKSSAHLLGCAKGSLALAHLGAFTEPANEELGRGEWGGS